MSTSEPIRGRGSATNPANRFIPLYRESIPGWTEEEDPAPRTRFFRDDAKTVLATNNSPDIPFVFSLNPYRGCEHGCAYCLSGDTPILMGDGSTRPLAEVRVGDRIYGTVRDGWYRRYVLTEVKAHWSVTKPAYRVRLGGGTELIAGPDHRFLTERGWKFVAPSDGGPRPVLNTDDVLLGSGPDASRPDRTDSVGQLVKGSASLRVVGIEPPGIELPLYDITTGTGDFIANGVVSHNCYARPGHEYLGLSAGLDFETQIFVKEDAPERLRAELSSPKWVPQTVSVSGVTDPYQPVERRLQLTRRCLQVFAEFRNPVGIVTKNALVARDKDVLAELAKYDAAAVFLSITTLDPELSRTMEPRASIPEARLRALRELTDAGVPTGILMAPVIPGLTDHEAPAILRAAADAGARTAGYVPLRLPFVVKDLFADWLQRHYPERKERVLGRIREIRGGQLNDSTFGRRMRGQGEWADVFGRMFKLHRKRVGLDADGPGLSAAHFTTGRPRQGNLFEE